MTDSFWTDYLRKKKMTKVSRGSISRKIIIGALVRPAMVVLRLEFMLLLTQGILLIVFP